MMKYVPMRWILFLTSALFVASVFAGNNLTQRKTEVVKLVKSAIEYVQQEGKDAALKEFNKPNGKFSKDDLYIFAYYYRGPQKNICLAHGLYPEWAGKDKTDFVDPITKAQIISFFAQVALKGGGWVIYHFEDPLTHTIEVKHGYVLPVPGEDFYLGSGCYDTTFDPS